MFPLGLTTIYEIFSLFVVFGKIMCPIIIEEANRRNLNIDVPDVYWHYNDLKVAPKEKKKTEEESPEEQQTASTNNPNVYAYTVKAKAPNTPPEQEQASPSYVPPTSSDRSDKDLTLYWKDLPEYTKLRNYAKKFYWVNAVVFAVIYVLSTVAGTEATGLHRDPKSTRHGPGLANSNAWVYLILVIAILSVVTGVIEIFGDWFIQRRVEKHNRKIS